MLATKQHAIPPQLSKAAHWLSQLFFALCCAAIEAWRERWVCEEDEGSIDECCQQCYHGGTQMRLKFATPIAAGQGGRCSDEIEIRRAIVAILDLLQKMEQVFCYLEF